MLALNLSIPFLIVGLFIMKIRKAIKAEIAEKANTDKTNDQYGFLV